MVGLNPNDGPDAAMAMGELRGRRQAEDPAQEQESLGRCSVRCNAAAACTVQQQQPGSRFEAGLERFGRFVLWCQFPALLAPDTRVSRIV